MKSKAEGEARYWYASRPPMPTTRWCARYAMGPIPHTTPRYSKMDHGFLVSVGIPETAMNPDPMDRGVWTQINSRGTGPWRTVFKGYFGTRLLLNVSTIVHNLINNLILFLLVNALIGLSIETSLNGSKIGIGFSSFFQKTTSPWQRPRRE